MEYPIRKTQKVYSLKLSLNAISNFDEITGYIAFNKKEPLSAIGVGGKIFNVIERIGKNPFAFRECEEIKTKSRMYRKAVCMSWLIIYKVSGTEILILGIIHSSRQPLTIKKLRKTI
ncbi:MAG: type II toxin-antitoxin system RelE/ParE family toxin [Draconibacterium sp.]